jgi:hypothetical protein
MRFKKEKAEIKGVPAEFIHLDEETGELCVGDDCFKVKYSPSENEIAIEVDPSAPCNPRMQKLAKMFLKKFSEGRPKVKIREKRRLDD